MWQDRGGSGKSEGKGTQKSTVRIAVISVMMHCLRHLPADDFASELPRILGTLTFVKAVGKPWRYGNVSYVHGFFMFLFFAGCTYHS